jgi:hypothetical protein
VPEVADAVTVTAWAQGKTPDCWNDATRCSTVSEASNASTVQATTTKAKIKAQVDTVLLGHPLRFSASNSYTASIGMLSPYAWRLVEFRSRFFPSHDAFVISISGTVRLAVPLRYSLGLKIGTWRGMGREGVPKSSENFQIECRAISASYAIGPCRREAQGETLFWGTKPVALSHRAVELLWKDAASLERE